MTATKFDGFHARIAHVMAKMPEVMRNEANNHGGYMYAGADAVYRAVRGLLAEACLSVLLDIDGLEMEKVRNAKGEDKMWIRVKAAITLTGPDGGDAPVTRHLMLPLTGPQTFEAAVTYLQKQFLRQRFLIDTGERDADTFAPVDIEGVEEDPLRDLSPGDLVLQCNEDGLHVTAFTDDRQVPREAIFRMAGKAKETAQKKLYTEIKRMIVEKKIDDEVLKKEQSRYWLAVLPTAGTAELTRIAADTAAGEPEATTGEKEEDDKDDV